MSEQTTHKLIKELAKDNKPIKPLRVLNNFAIWSATSLSVIIFYVFARGNREDIMLKLEEKSFAIELGLFLITGLIAAFSANWLSLPDAKQRKWLCFLPYVPLATLVAIIGYKTSQQHAYNLISGDSSIHCALDLLFVSTIPAILLFFFLKKAATVHNIAAAVTSSISLFCLSYVGTRLICPRDDLSHLIYWHYLPVLTLGIITAFIGSKILKW